MSPQWFSGTVSEKIELTSRFIQVHIELKQPDLLSFQAGQYIVLDIPGSQKKNSYSITSSPDLNHAIELLVDVSPGGPGSMYISQIKPGDPVKFFAPAGRFIVPSQQECPEDARVFVATGSGIAPMKSMISDLLRAREEKIPMILYWGMREENDLFWLEKFEDLSSTYPHFSFHLVLSKAAPEWTLCRGHVTDCLEIHPQPQNAGYYVCGSKHMVEDVKELLLAKGILPEHIHHEQFY